MTRIDDRDDALVAHFKAHPVFERLEGMSRSEFLVILLQRRFLSLAFSPIYDMAIDAISDAAFKACAREILREEYGTRTEPTHREDLVSDLLSLGATREQIVSSSASSSTIRVIAELFGMLRKQEDESLFQTKVLTTLRLAGEILVATEYELLWPHLRRLGLSAPGNSTGARSVFYYPHMCHDARKQRLGGELNPLEARTHTDRLTDCLRSHLAQGPPEGVAFCIRTAELAVSVKRSFYDQFPTI